MGYGLFGLFLMLVLLVGLIVLAVWLTSALLGSKKLNQPPPTDKSSNPRDILDQRYARGEITRGEYELMKQDIR